MKRTFSLILVLILLLGIFPMAAFAEGVVITSQPKSVTVGEGETAKVSVRAEGDGLRYVWYYKNAGASSYKKSSVTSRAYSVEMNDSRDGRRVYCRITDKYGNSVKSNTVSLNMETPLTITSQPKSVTVGKGETAKVSVRAEGDGLRYVWYYKNAGASSYKKSSVTSRAYSVEMNDSRDGRKVYCRITDKYGNSVRSKTVSLNMDQGPVITAQPQSVTVDKGYTARVIVEAEGEGLEYVWYYKNPGSSSYKKSSVTDKAYSVEMNESRDGRKVYCRITDKYGNSVKSKTVSLNMEPPVKITEQPQNALVPEGTFLNTTVHATGYNLQYAWYYKNKGDSSFSKSSVTTNTYTIEMNSARAGRQVYCKITDIYGHSVKSDTVTLDMQVPLKITSQPRNVTAAEGTPVTFTVAATGAGLKYAWYYQDPGDESFTQAEAFTGSTYTDTVSAAHSGRQVYCEITDTYGNIVRTKPAAINLTCGITITKQPEEKRVKQGNSVSVSVEAEGEGLTYLWYLKSAENGAFYPQTSRYDRKSSYWFYTYENMPDRQAYCVITDANGNSIATDTVTLGCHNVKILHHPENQTASAGKKITLSVKATGHDLSYAWYRKYSGYSSNYVFVGENSPEYTFTMTKELDGAAIYCVVTDSFGTDEWSSAATLNLPPLSITEHPKSVEIVQGEKAKLTVMAYGEDVKYQWYYRNPGSSEFRKSSVTGRTYTTALTRDNSGREVYCLVTDKSGQTAKSYTATITVHAPVEITNQPVDKEAVDGYRAVFTCGANGLDLTFKWYYKNPGSSSYTLSDQTGSSFSFTAEKHMHGRRVYCKVTDRAGNTVKSSSAKLSIYEPDASSQPCSVCNGSGDCPKCGGDMWTFGWEWEWVYVNGSPELERVNKLRLCDGPFCYGGTCEKCQGSGYEIN